MKPRRDRDPERLTALADAEDAGMRRAAQLMAAASPLATWNESTRTWLIRKVRARLRARPRRPHLGWALAAVLLLLGGGAIGSAIGFGLLKRDLRQGDGPTPSGQEKKAETTRLAPAAVLRETPASKQPVRAADLEAKQGLVEPARAQSPRRLARVQGPSRLAFNPEPRAKENEPAELTVLGQVYQALRQDGDPARALALLDGNRVLLDDSALAREALSARAEALSALGRDSDALQLLEAAVLGRNESPGLLVFRGELRAAAGDCASAMDDFAPFLSEGGGSSRLHERALYGTAACLVRQHQPARARPMFQQYLQTYPSGRFAPLARAAVEQLTPSP